MFYALATNAVFAVLAGLFLWVSLRKIPRMTLIEEMYFREKRTYYLLFIVVLSGVGLLISLIARSESREMVEIWWLIVTGIQTSIWMGAYVRSSRNLEKFYDEAEEADT